MTLDVMIATYGNQGIIRTSNMILPQIDGVRYIVSWQIPKGETPTAIPESLKRNDIDVFSHFSTGVSKNRNHALSKATADYCLIADDDLIYFEDGIRDILKVFRDNPDTDIFAFKAECKIERKVPSYSFDLKHPPRFYWPIEFEVAFKLKSIQRYNICFNELFGVNAPVLKSGEIAAILHQAFYHGLQGKFWPITICQHPKLTTWSRKTSDTNVIMSLGATYALLHPYTWPLRALINSYRQHKRNGGKISYIFKNFIKGALYRYKYISADGSIKSKYKE